ncbi:MAG TPA: glycosyltransferase family protein, partial [Propionibacteriaceae bacterium]|nr:glycosyltransferase family protein [Propionibacteriaceae bacterium]
YGRPDLVISDYDMVSAQIAYLFDAPLVTLDQQSKFLGYECPNFDEFTPGEHRRRLGYFFPKAALRVATSFFTVDYPPVPEFPVTVIPPILGRDVVGRAQAPVPGNVTVYLSAASHILQPVEEIVALFGQLPDHRFTCYLDADVAHVPANVTLRPGSRAAFVDTLSRSDAVISTAGHNLITEAAYLRVPMLLVPFHHYEQQLNARIVTESGIGRASEVLTLEGVGAFLEGLDEHRRCLDETTRLFRRYDGDMVFLDLVEDLMKRRG